MFDDGITVPGRYGGRWAVAPHSCRAFNSTNSAPDIWNECVRGNSLHGNVEIRHDESSRFPTNCQTWDNYGVIAASLQIGKFPPNQITGIVKDGDVLVLTTTVRENGKPIWAVIALTLEGPGDENGSNA